jgi:hypothetical protein
MFDFFSVFIQPGPKAALEFSQKQSFNITIKTAMKNPENPGVILD